MTPRFRIVDPELKAPARPPGESFRAAMSAASGPGLPGEGRDFGGEFRALFEALGLTVESTTAVAKGAKRKPVSMPEALAAYHRTHGPVDRYDSPLPGLIGVNQLSVVSGRLAMLLDEESEIVWGVSADRAAGDDPMVWKAMCDDPIMWEPVEATCSTFLKVMTCWECVCGGALPHAESATVSASLVATLDRDWTFLGELDGMRAYHQGGVALSFVEWGEGNWTVFVASAEAGALDAVAERLELSWE